MTRSTEECEMSRSCHSGDVFKRRLRVGAHDAGQAADLFQRDRVALVRHGGGALLLFAEELFGFADFGALQVADFGGDLVERAGDDGQRGDVGGVAVALDHLRRDGGGFQSQPLADALFELGAEVGEGADGSGELAHAHVFGGAAKARDVALGLGVPVGQLESEGDGLGVDAVGAADHGRVFELPGAAFEDCRKAFPDRRR